jgi:hypothetical protein
MLRFGSTEVPVILVNESAEGLGVLTGDPGKLRVNRIGLLKTNSVWYEVRVIYVLRNESADMDGVEQEGKFRLGLQRLREIPRQNEARINCWRSRIVGFLLPRESCGTFTGLSLTVLSVTLVLALLVFATTTWTHVRPMITGWLHGQPADAGTAREAGKAAATASDVAPGVFRDLARRVPGAEVFLLPEVAEAMGLIASEQAEIRHLSETTRQALAEVQRRWPDDSRQAHAHRRAMIQEAARRETLLLVTGLQRQRWERLSQ